MRISDWSSDVCSSDLRPRPAGRHPRTADRDRRLYRAGPRGPHPDRARLRRGDAGPAARQLLRRVEDARRARRAALLQPRPAVALRAIGSAHVCTPVTNPHLVFPLLLVLISILIFLP